MDNLQRPIDDLKIVVGTARIGAKSSAGDPVVLASERPDLGLAELGRKIRCEGLAGCVGGHGPRMCGWDPFDGAALYDPGNLAVFTPSFTGTAANEEFIALARNDRISVPDSHRIGNRLRSGWLGRSFASARGFAKRSPSSPPQ